MQIPNNTIEHFLNFDFLGIFHVGALIMCLGFILLSKAKSNPCANFVTFP